MSAVRKVLAGGKYISVSMGESLADDLGRDFSKPLHECLSDREYDVMLRIGSGKTVGEIAEEIHLSVKTISTYRARILEKMHMKNNADLTQYCMRENWLPFGPRKTKPKGVANDVSLRSVDELAAVNSRLADSERQYREMFEGHPEPMWVLDAQSLAFLSVNDAAMLRYGYTREEFLARSILDILPQDEIPAAITRFQKIDTGQASARASPCTTGKTEA